MSFSECQTANDATARAMQYDERQAVLESLSFRVAMGSPDKIRRRKRLANRAKNRQKKFAF